MKGHEINISWAQGRIYSARICWIYRHVHPTKWHFSTQIGVLNLTGSTTRKKNSIFDNLKTRYARIIHQAFSLVKKIFLKICLFIWYENIFIKKTISWKIKIILKSTLRFAMRPGILNLTT